MTRKRPMKPAAGLLLLAWAMTAGLPADDPPPSASVDPRIGTREMGHTYPGATVPFGMVQVSPDTGSPPFFIDGRYNPEVYRYCAGYQYDDPTILGFSHTHFNGTGHSDLGDFLLVPTLGGLQLEPGTAADPGSGYRSRFCHREETARPGYYAVTLKDHGIRAELTATCRTGLHRYTFHRPGEGHVILDLDHGIYDYDGKVLWSEVRVRDDRTVTGSRQTEGWARNRTLYFALRFSRPFAAYGHRRKDHPGYRGFWSRAVEPGQNFPLIGGRRIVLFFDFPVQKGEAVLAKMALSAVSARGALANLEEEVPDWDFDRVRRQAEDRWRRILGRVEIDAPGELSTVFYTALYHTLLGPVTYMDTDHRYRGVDREVHRAEGYTHYTIFSLWDTYRALHPWLTLFQPRRAGEMVRSMLDHYRQNAFGILPVWSFHANETWCMTGYHGVSVIADAAVKGIKGFDPDLALQAAVDSATREDYGGLGAYMNLGYVPSDHPLGDHSASKTLEYAYDDFSVYCLAEKLGKEKIAREFRRRARNYQNLFDPDTGFIRARDSEGTWLTPFDPLETTGMGYIEGNAWNYSLHVPHDIRGYIDLLGGPEKLETMLDTLFTMETPESAIAGSEDITRRGILGGYIHGNEPGHHLPYLYNYVGAPWKTQRLVRRVLAEMYTAGPDGIPGNDDTGQMSAWYVFGALGFYPVCPGTDQYVIGSPGVPGAVLHLENGNDFIVRTENWSPQNVYIQQVTLNGTPLTRAYIRHSEITAGGVLRFLLGPEPNRQWASGPSARPDSLSSE